MQTHRLANVRGVLSDLRVEVDAAMQLLEDAEAAPTQPDHQAALRRLLPQVRRVRQLGQTAAAEVGAAEAVR